MNGFSTTDRTKYAHVSAASTGGESAAVRSNLCVDRAQDRNIAIDSAIVRVKRHIAANHDIACKRYRTGIHPAVGTEIGIDVQRFCGECQTAGRDRTAAECQRHTNGQRIVFRIAINRQRRLIRRIDAADRDRIITATGVDRQGRRRIDKRHALSGARVDRHHAIRTAAVGERNRLLAAVERERAVRGAQVVGDRFQTGIDDNRRVSAACHADGSVVLVGEGVCDVGDRRCAVCDVGQAVASRSLVTAVVRDRVGEERSAVIDSQLVVAVSGVEQDRRIGWHDHGWIRDPIAGELIRDVSSVMRHGEHVIERRACHGQRGCGVGDVDVLDRTERHHRTAGRDHRGRRCHREILSVEVQGVVRRGVTGKNDRLGKVSRRDSKRVVARAAGQCPELGEGQSACGGAGVVAGVRLSRAERPSCRDISSG